MIEEYDNTNPLLPFAPRQLGSETVNTVNGKDLYSFLSPKRDYATWIRYQVKRAKLFKDSDFIVFPTFGENPKGGRPILEYHLAFDAAKRIAMMASTEKGNEIRSYFLECERRANSAVLPTLHDPALQAILQLTVRLDATQHQLALVNAKAELALANQAWLTIREYVYLEKLARQMPPSLCKTFGVYLTNYCRENGVPIRDQPVADRHWKDEHSYHIEVIAQRLPGWLLRRNGQTTLSIVEKSPKKDIQ